MPPHCAPRADGGAAGGVELGRGSYRKGEPPHERRRSPKSYPSVGSDEPSVPRPSPRLRRVQPGTPVKPCANLLVIYNQPPGKLNHVTGANCCSVWPYCWIPAVAARAKRGGVLAGYSAEALRTTMGVVMNVLQACVHWPDTAECAAGHGATHWTRRALDCKQLIARCTLCAAIVGVEAQL